MYPIATPMECAPTGMRHAGGPPRAGPNWEGHWKQLGSRCPDGGAEVFLTWTSSAEAFSPHPPTAPRRLLSSWVRTCSRYMPGRASHGWQGRPVQAISRGPGGDANWGPGLSHSPSYWPWSPQEEGRERWFLLWGRKNRVVGVGDNNPGSITTLLPPRWSSGWSQPSEQPTMSTSDCRPVCRARVGQIWTSGW